MKVLFCSPYMASPDVVKGGIQMWGKYIISYHDSLGMSDIELFPVSFDRKRFNSNGDTPLLPRIYSGIKEVGAAYRNAAKQIKKIKPDVVHICSSASLSIVKDLMLINCAHRHGAKAVVHLHFGRVPELARKKNWEWTLLKIAVEKADVTIVMNKPTLDTLMAEGLNHIKYLPNPLSMEIIDSIKRHESIVDRNCRNLLYVGQVLRTKGVRELVSACAEIEDVKLRIVGQYEEDVQQELLEMASQRDGGKWLHFVGPVEHNKVIEEFMQAGIFVFPSYTEGFPNVILEAMACECPIASSDVGAIPEMLDIAGTPCGICYKPKNKDEVKNAIEKLINSPELCKQFATNAKTRVFELYAMPKVWDQLSSIWHNA